MDCGAAWVGYDRGVIEGRAQTWREHGFLLLLVVLCAVLTVLQFRWTGELARAEFARLGGDQQEAAESLAREFDRELTDSLAGVAPAVGSTPTLKSMTARVKAWRQGNPRPVFDRLGMALTGETGVQLYLLDPVKGTPELQKEWPEGWAELMDSLEARAAGIGGWPFRSSDGLLFEVPFFAKRSRGPGDDGGGPGGRTSGGDKVDKGGRSGGGGPGGGFGGGGPGGPGGPPQEMGWIIFELDPLYLRETWLPDLVRKHVNPGTRDIHRVEVAYGDEVIFSSGPTGHLGKPVTVSLNRQGRGEPPSMMRPGGMDGRWKLTTWRQTGALEQIVESSRRRSLALACGVNVLILAAGYALIRQTRKSRLLAEAKMNFVANVSHELRTPVTVMLGAAHNLKRGIVKKPEAQERYAELILQHGQQLSEMVQEVLEFSSAKKVLAPHEMKPVPLADLLRNTVDELAQELADIRVEVVVPEDLPPVAGEARSLARVFRNLIGNAAKHGADGGWIRVEAARAKDGVEVSVADGGPGIPAWEHARIFEPFFRGTEAHSRQTRGTGLGLGLVREIIQAHGGKISVSSAAGEGAKFTVNLPAAGETKHDS